MHRVELKAIKLDEGTSVIHKFLMHRVELKASNLSRSSAYIEKSS